MTNNIFKTKIGLALGGGAAKGIAHVGVLRALEDTKIPISFIAGTSVGAIVAALYAFNVDVTKIGELARRLTLSKVTNFRLSKTGFFSTDSLRLLMLEYLGEANIEDAAIPLAIVTTDISSGEEVVLTKGSVAEAVCASSAIPGIYVPVTIEGRKLVDGGLLQNVPVLPLREMGAQFTIASHLYSVNSYSQPNHALDIIRNAFEIAINAHTNIQLEEADLIFAMDLSDFSLRDNTHRYDELFGIGYNTATEKLTKLGWYHRTSFFFHLSRIIKLMAPFRSRLLNKKQSSIGSQNRF